MDKTIERKAIYKTFTGNPGSCPQCGGKLQNSYQSYMVATRTNGKMADSFMIGGDYGWFCASCPTVVLDKKELGKMLSFSMPGWKVGNEIIVLGLVNLDAVPEKNKHLRLGEPGNPIPLVRFSSQGAAYANKPAGNSKQSKLRKR
jgi:hypothetical protein